MTAMMKAMSRRVNREEEGQGLVEYALIIALVSVVLVGALQTLEGGIANVFSSITASF